MNNFLDFFRRFAATTEPDAPVSPRGPAPEHSDAFAISEQLGRGVTSQDIANALIAAGDGYPHEQGVAFVELMERDSMLAAHFATRRHAVLSCDWTVTSKKNPKLADEITRQLEAANIHGLIEHLLFAVPFGYSGAVLDWAVGGGELRGWLPVAPWAWEFDSIGNPAFVSATTGRAESVASRGGGKQDIVVFAGGSGLPCRRGLLRPLAWLFLIKNTTFKNWGRFVEKFGIPVAIITAASGNDESARAIVAAVRSAGANAALVAGDEARVTFSGANSASQDAFAGLSTYIDACYATLILGQTASSGDSSGLSGGDAQSQVRDDLRGSDARLIIDAVQRQIIAPLVQHATGATDAGDVRFWIDYEDGEDEKALADTWKVVSEVTGRKIDTDLAAERFGVRFQDAAPQTPPPLSDTRMLALADRATTTKSKREGALVAITQEALRRTVADEQAAAEWLGPVRHAVKKAFADIDPSSPTAMDDFTKRLPEFMATIPGLYSEMDTAKFERHLAGAMLAAAVNGYLEPG
jgi:phage gp29-like protein